MVNPAHEAAVFERLFGPGPHLLRGAEVLTEQALFARFFDEEAANQALMAPPLEAVEETVVEPEVVVEAVSSPAPEPAPVAEPVSFFARVKQGLTRTRAGLSDGLAGLLLGKKAIDDELLEDIETQLLVADVGMDATAKIIAAITERMNRKELKDSDALYDALQEEMTSVLRRSDAGGGLQIDSGKQPYVILMVGVNGVGKTTTIGKLAKKLQQEGKSVMLAAGDTFRAAAVEQLQVWGERNNIPVVAQHTGADSASVIFDAVQSAQSRGVDVLIADTAGRLHTKSNLMDELSKVKRVMAKLDTSAPHEVMLVLDAGTGQNALSQAEQFHQAVGVTGITLTKLDGTAKGGIVFAIASRMGLPIRFIGVGEQIDDLRPFAADEFVRALFDR
ncbi:MAG: signal recognition particle-docking protein FtsY [Pseudomonadales bacterium]|jgi:fused signal recognition particle receptor|uniref:signal recognition particle-docking protein FtsY n=1 Tax=unclassified Ketobacter TaxID=2639109 RepID=UPI000C94312B|nr:MULTISPECIES: signal recognition particle-docking protein FtsY [unclassified Ketobacter]MAA59404.1 signal recognition particle-docking protein FtsY [Pseudomonadales bacterium]TNC89997.1 MAG: signal recognition particle-docking protein FtsY [Alcanivorax sp.]HAG95117.1 signal recognition particle-docking protein FtsY [Gammaproteobacteria bacterium]MAQ26847.1 signal recognition particle-docking protein FtsY [Pseudomonadales bacterium]MCK5792625.1 signal recognition particle-docking protein Fts|tara:strand:- start:647 stop:1816 length:1170 start_codon:yes stop_codon:yes gene_type:complete